MKEKLTEQLIRDEGVQYKPYTCTAGKLTIGIGRNIDDNGINHSEALLMLENDVTRCINEIDKNLPWVRKLNDQRSAALVNMAFNLGITRLLKFKKMLAALEVGEYITASNEMLDSKWARQVPKRARRLASQMEAGKWVD